MSRIHRNQSVGIVLAILAVGAVFLAACNTTRGLGKDVENLGENIQDAAD